MSNEPQKTVQDLFKESLIAHGKETMCSDPEIMEVMGLAFEMRSDEVKTLECEIDHLKLLQQTMSEQLNTYLAQ